MNEIFQVFDLAYRVQKIEVRYKKAQAIFDAHFILMKRSCLWHHFETAFVQSVRQK